MLCRATLPAPTLCAIISPDTMSAEMELNDDPPPMASNNSAVVSLPPGHDTKMECADTDSGRATPCAATDASKQPTAKPAFVDEVHAWLNRNLQDSSHSLPLSVIAPPFSDTDRSKHHSEISIPQEALSEAARRKKETQSRLSTEGERGKIKRCSHKRVSENSTSSDADVKAGPSFDVVAFEQIQEVDEAPMECVPQVQASKKEGETKHISFHDDPAQPDPSRTSSGRPSSPPLTPTRLPQTSPHGCHSPASGGSKGGELSSQKSSSKHKNPKHKNGNSEKADARIQSDRVKHKNRVKFSQHNDDDDVRSRFSQDSGVTQASVFTTMSIKVRSFRNIFKLSRRKNKNQNRKQQNPPSLEVKTQKRVSGRKKSKHKPSAGSESTTATSGSNSNSPISSFTNNGGKQVKPPASMHNKCILEGEPYGIGEQSIDPSASKTRVFDLPWLDNSSNGVLHGLYSGPVNTLLQPHGEGTLVLKGNNFLKFYGHWKNGELVSPLINEDEKRIEDVERIEEVASSKDQDNKSSSKEYKKTPPNVYSDYREPKHHSPSDSSSDSTKEDDNNTIVTKEHDNSSIVSKEYQKKSSKEYKQKSSKEYKKTYPKDHSPSANSLASTKSKMKYELGEVARTPRDMVIHRSNKRATQSVSILKKYDQAFLKRSNGLWTVSVVADRGLQPTTASSSRWYTKYEIDKETMELEESMLFVIDEDGATKIVKKRHWGRYIRCIEMDDMRTSKSVATLGDSKEVPASIVEDAAEV